MAFKRSTKVMSDLAMSSMTDLVFLLLIFFLITSTLINPNALKLLLPKSTGQVSAKATVSASSSRMRSDISACCDAADRSSAGGSAALSGSARPASR